MTRPGFDYCFKGRLSEMDDRMDIAYWQRKSDSERFAEAWRLARIARTGMGRRAG